MSTFILTWDGSDTGYFRTNHENDVPGHHWNHIFASGQRVRPPTDADLAERWAEHLKDVDGDD